MSRWEGPVAHPLPVSVRLGLDQRRRRRHQCAAERAAASGAWSGRCAGPRNGPDRRVRRDARLLFRADPLRARGAGRDDALLHPRRAAALRADLGRPAPRADGDAVPETERQLDRRRREPQLLQGSDRRRRGDPRVQAGPAPCQDDGRRPPRRADRQRQPRPPKLRAQLREQHPVRRPGIRCEVRARQDDYLAQSDRVSREEVADYGIVRRLWQNLLATLSPML